MRSFIASFLIAGAAAIATIDEFASCASATLKVAGCEASDAECFCSKVNGINQLSNAAATACSAAGLDVKDLEAALCSTTSRVATPFRHASKPMELASVSVKRAYAPESGDIAMPRIVYVTATHTEYACESTPAAEMPTAPAETPVAEMPNAPASSSYMGAMDAASAPMAMPSNSHGAMMVASSPPAWSAYSTPSAPSWSAAPSAPAYSHGLMGKPSASVRYAPKLSAYPTPSGASAGRFDTFKGAAPQISAAYSSVVAVSVAAVMGLMMAL